MALTFTATGGGAEVDYSAWEDQLYTLELTSVTTVENRFYKEGSEDGSTPEQWQWQWRVVDKPGVEVRTWTNTTFGKASTARHIGNCLLGREIQDGEALDQDAFIGQRCRVMVTLDPGSGYPRIKGGKAAFMMPRATGQSASPAAPAAPAPSPVAAPPADQADGPAASPDITPAQVRAIHALAERKGISTNDLLTHALVEFAATSLEELTAGQAGELMIAVREGTLTPF